MREKLTKHFLMKLPIGTYIMSNVFHEYGLPVYANKVSAIHNRKSQWKAVVAASADQRLCHVFKSKEDAGEWLSELFQV